jgi:glycosyltransferase involved in cell wall biosynthesis
MQKILVIHNEYQNFGGEDQSVKNEILLLEKYFNVETLIIDNNIKEPLNDIYSLLFNKNIQFEKKLNDLINNFNPDLVYVHNTWFKISLNIFEIIKKLDIPIYIKLHNFRYFCTKSYSVQKHLNYEDFCQACGLQKKKFQFFNKYFKNSYIKSFLVIKYGKKYFKILQDASIKIMVLTEFHKTFLEEQGIKNNKVSVVPNYLPINYSENSQQSENYFVYAGRLSPEKGIEEMLEAFNNKDLKEMNLKIIGDGPLLNYLVNKYKYSHNYEFFGSIDNKDVLKIIEKSRAVITTTKLFEGQPTLLCEASSFGKPSIFPKTGGIAEFFPKEYALSFTQFNYDDLVTKINLTKTINISKVGLNNKEYISEFLNEKKIIKLFKQVFN